MFVRRWILALALLCAAAIDGHAAPPGEPGPVGVNGSHCPLTLRNSTPYTLATVELKASDGTTINHDEFPDAFFSIRQLLPGETSLAPGAEKLVWIGLGNYLLLMGTWEGRVYVVPSVDCVEGGVPVVDVSAEHAMMGTVHLINATKTDIVQVHVLHIAPFSDSGNILGSTVIRPRQDLYLDDALVGERGVIQAIDSLGRTRIGNYDRRQWLEQTIWLFERVGQPGKPCVWTVSNDSTSPMRVVYPESAMGDALNPDVTVWDPIAAGGERDIIVSPDRWALSWATDAGEMGKGPLLDCVDGEPRVVHLGGAAQR